MLLMKKTHRRLFVLVVALLLLGVVVKVSWDLGRPPFAARGTLRSGGAESDFPRTSVANESAPEATTAATGDGPDSTVRPAQVPAAPGGPGAADPEVPVVSSRLSTSLTDPAVHFSEAVLLFTQASSYQSFLNNAGFAVTGKIPELLAVRVRANSSEEIDAIINASLVSPETELFDTDLNWKMPLVNAISPVGPEVGAPIDFRFIVGIWRNRFRDFRPHAVDNSAWGVGSVIAFLDTGIELNIAPLRGRLDRLDAGWGVEPVDRQGTALAVLVAGSLNLARGFIGIAPQAQVLGVRVTASDGFSDVFTVAQGIVAAVNAGATVIEIGPASPRPAAVLTRAVTYAFGKPGLAVVAAKAPDLSPSWPASNNGVIAVGPIDAMVPPAIPDGETVRTTGAPQIRTPVVPGPNLNDVWVESDSNPASAAIVATAMAVATNTYPGNSAAEVWAAMQRTVFFAEGVIGPAGTDYRIISIEWVGRTEPPPAADVADGGGAQLPPALADTTPPPAPSAFIPGTTAIDPATGRPRVTVRGGQLINSTRSTRAGATPTVRANLTSTPAGT
jgi:hypothetical protein